MMDKWGGGSAAEKYVFLHVRFCTADSLMYVQARSIMNRLTWR